ncbi:MAG: hypothetical protein IPH58_02780 [Sphingobacteriales bacterium]|nr:hypothetical protein [Sphingobacteriales bacterium]
MVTNKAGGSFGKILLFNNTIYALNGYNQAVKVKVFDAGNLATIADNFITDGTTLKIPYGIAIDETNGDMYVTDAVDYVTSGRVYAFGKDGKKKFDFTVTGGIDPNAVLFKR